MSDNRVFKKCLQKVAANSELGPINEWTHRDFEQLSLSIEKKTKISLSVSTLIRLYKEPISGKPQKSTLDALARFIDFDSWHEYSVSLAPVIEEKVESIHKSDKIRSLGSKTGFLIIAVIVIISSIYLMLTELVLHPSSEFDPEDYSFNIDPTEADGVPSTVKLVYDIPKKDKEPIKVRYETNPEDAILLDPNESFSSHTYYYPGYKRIGFFRAEQKIEDISFLIKSNGWLIYFFNESLDKIPFYVPQDLHINYDGALRATMEMKKRLGITQNTPHSTFYYFVDDLGSIESKDFQLNVKIKNAIAEGGSMCQESHVFILCKDGYYDMAWSGIGCGGNSSYKISEERIDGSAEDLSCLECDLNDWQNLGLLIQGSKAIITLNNQEVMTREGASDYGQIVGLCFIFKGLGAIDDVNLTNSLGYVAIDEDFEF